eukprot:COSAG06_NODE_1941_length_8015_cov_2.703007_8_plen_75_part_00
MLTHPHADSQIQMQLQQRVEQREAVEAVEAARGGGPARARGARDTPLEHGKLSPLLLRKLYMYMAKMQFDENRV